MQYKNIFHHELSQKFKQMCESVLYKCEKIFLEEGSETSSSEVLKSSSNTEPIEEQYYH